MARRRWPRRVGIGAAVLLLVAAAGAVVGLSRSLHVLTVTRTTTATPEYLWPLWADPVNPPRWDQAVEYARVDGPFAVGQTGVVKVKGQAERAFTVIECTPQRSYTDRFHLPAGTAMDWHHTIVDTGPTRTVTFRVEVRGPNALVLKPILGSILRGELPGTVEKFVAVAEADMRADRGS